MNKQTHFGNIVIFGGTGFIGRNFAVFLLEQKLTSTVCLVDIKPLEEEHTNSLIKELIDEGCLQI